RKAVHRTELVAVGVAQVGEVHAAGRAFAHAGRVLDGDAAGGHARRVPRVHLGRGFAGETDGAAVGVGGGLAVDRQAHAEHAAVGRAIEDPVAVHEARADAQRAQEGVVEGLGLVQVVGPDHHV